MPRRSDKSPKAAIEGNPHFANRPGVDVVEVIHLPAASLTDKQAEDLRRGTLASGLRELAELLGNAMHASPQSLPAIITDARMRVATLQFLAGL